MKHQYITNAWINGFLSGLTDLGIDLAELESGLPDLNVESIRNGQRVNTTLLRQIWHRADDLSQDPLLGYKIGRRLDIKGLGALAPLLMHSPTLRTSVEHVAQYHSLINPSGCLSISYEAEERFGFHYVPTPGVIRENPHQVLSLLTNMIYMGNYMHIKERSVLRLELPAQLDLRLIESRLRIETHSSENQYSMWFKVEGLDDPIAGTDTHFYHLTKGYIDDLLIRQKSGNDLVSSIKSLIVENGYLSASVDHITESLDINKRSLQRSLSEESTSFRTLKEELIKDKALNLIAHGNASLDDIAQTLGYSETSAFHRAFKSWFGVTPKDFRGSAEISLR